MPQPHHPRQAGSMTIEIATGEDLDRLQTYFQNQIATLKRRITTMAEATQADIDNLTTQVQQVETDLGTTRDKLQAEIDSLASAGVDVTNLQAALAPLDDQVKALGDLQPTPPPAA